MVLKYKEFIKEGLRDQMKPKSEEDVEEVLSSMIFNGEYLNLIPTVEGLKIELTEEGKKVINDYEFWELFEDVQGNSGYKFHPNLGWDDIAMTDAPGITYGYNMGDDGEWEELEPNSYLYMYDDYIITSFFNILSKIGEVLFQRN